MARPTDNTQRDDSEPDVVRAAIDGEIEKRRRDVDFLERLEQRHKHEKPLFDRLAK